MVHIFTSQDCLLSFLNSVSSIVDLVLYFPLILKKSLVFRHFR